MQAEISETTQREGKRDLLTTNKYAEQQREEFFGPQTQKKN